MSPYPFTSSSRAIFILALVLAGFSACVNIGPDSEPIQTFVFDPDLPAAQHQSATSGVLLVSTPRAYTTYQTRRLIYTDRAFEIRSYAYNTWADSPAAMLEPLLIRVAERSGQFRSVVGLSAGVRADYRLDTEITALHQEFGQSGSIAHVALRLRIIDLADRSVVAQSDIDVTAPAPSDDAYGGVMAINDALSEALSDLLRFIVQEGPRPSDGG
ncbi:MAG: membrane integrity-associated transporter subunit PqiC [Myxococcales bacterium]|nr:membrane integrity-associated transporter subunit PqiC [Myxococcales bacterium]